MSKLISLAAFFYFCYYAGNLAFPSTKTGNNPVEIRTIQADSNSIKPVSEISLTNAASGDKAKKFFLAGIAAAARTKDLITVNHSLSSGKNALFALPIIPNLKQPGATVPVTKTTGLPGLEYYQPALFKTGLLAHFK